MAWNDCMLIVMLGVVDDRFINENTSFLSLDLIFVETLRSFKCWCDRYCVFGEVWIHLDLLFKLKSMCKWRVFYVFGFEPSQLSMEGPVVFTKFYIFSVNYLKCD